MHDCLTEHGAMLSRGAATEIEAHLQLLRCLLEVSIP